MPRSAVLAQFQRTGLYLNGSAACLEMVIMKTSHPVGPPKREGRAVLEASVSYPVNRSYLKSRNYRIRGSSQHIVAMSGHHKSLLSGYCHPKPSR
jgi:hypothetical protein